MISPEVVAHRVVGRTVGLRVIDRIIGGRIVCRISSVIDYHISSITIALKTRHFISIVHQ